MNGGIKSFLFLFNLALNRLGLKGEEVAKGTAIASGVACATSTTLLLLRELGMLPPETGKVSALGLITPPTKVYVEEGPPIERIDENYIRTKTKWFFVVDTMTKVAFGGYLWDSQTIKSDIESQKSNYGERFEARKSLTIEITPKSLRILVPLISKSKTVLVGKSGVWANDDCTEWNDTRTKPLSINYYVTGDTMLYEDTFTVTVNGKSSDFSPYVSESITFEGVTFEKIGHLIGDVSIPNYSNIMLIPVPPDQTARNAVTDSKGKRWIILRDARTIESIYMDPSSNNSYNYEIWGNENGGDREAWTDVKPGQAPFSDLLPDWEIGFGWGFIFVQVAGAWLYGRLWVYPRQADIWNNVNGFSTPGHNLIWSRIEVGGDFKLTYDGWDIFLVTTKDCYRVEKPIPGFINWLVNVAKDYITDIKRQTTFGTYGSQWYVETRDGNPYLVIDCPLTVLIPLVRFSFPGELADVVVYSPLAGKFKIVSATIDKTDLYGGEDAILRVTVQNVGSFEASAVIKAIASNLTVTPLTQTVTLNVNETKTVSFNVHWGGNVETTSSIRIELYNSTGQLQDTTSINVRLHPAPEEKVLFKTYSIAPPVKYGVTSTLTVTITNTSSKPQTVYIDAVAESPLSVSPARNTLTAPPGDSNTTFTVTTTCSTCKEARNITLRLFKDTALQDTLVISVVPEVPPTPPPPPPPPVEKKLDLLLATSIATAMAFAASSGYLLLKKK